MCEKCLMLKKNDFPMKCVTTRSLTLYIDSSVFKVYQTCLLLCARCLNWWAIPIWFVPGDINYRSVRLIGMTSHFPLSDHFSFSIPFHFFRVTPLLHRFYLFSCIWTETLHLNWDTVLVYFSFDFPSERGTYCCCCWCFLFIFFFSFQELLRERKI